MGHVVTEYRPPRGLAAFVFSVVLSLFFASVVFGQNRSERIHKLPPGGVTPRTKDGHPDLSGVWFPNSAGQALNAARLAGEEDEVDEDARRQFDPKVNTEEKPSFQPWAATKIKAMTSTDSQLERPSVNCMPRGVPGMLATAYPIQIVSTPGQFVELVELNNNFRVVSIGKREHTKNPDPLFNGDSVAHWDGDTLVIDTISLDERTWNDLNGWFHSDQERVIERISRPSENYLIYQLTIEDPKVLTKPWTSAPRKWSLSHDALQEYYCTENYEIEELKKIKEKEEREK
jgi:hypothetical protein